MKILAWILFWLGMTEKPKRKFKNDEQVETTPHHQENVYQKAMLLAIGAALIICVFLVMGVLGSLDGPARMGESVGELPTVITAPSPHPTASSSWATQTWLSQTEARSLRAQSNVINLAYLKTNGGVNYSSDSSVVLTESWETGFAKPSGFQALSVNGTILVLQINNLDYTLNIYQPFVVENVEEYVYMVDQARNLYRFSADAVEVTRLEQAQNLLPVSIEPNPGLSFSY